MPAQFISVLFISFALYTRSRDVGLCHGVQRFQKAYESLEHEAALERKRLLAEHQRRIHDQLARKKTEAMNQYLDALADDEPDVSSLLFLLLSFILKKMIMRLLLDVSI